MIRSAAALTAVYLLAGASRRPAVRHIKRFSRVVADLDRAADFYSRALCFQPVSSGALDGAYPVPATGHARETVLRLGGQEISLVQFDTPGAPYPRDSRSNDAWFQHLALVVSDIDAAIEHLRQYPGWTPISEAGPITLPPSNGSVRAFKFRDLDGHPLELIWFPAGPRPYSDKLFTRIDHSALAVRDAARSAGFYRSLGFHVAARSFNHGPAQDRLDGMQAAAARIISLKPPERGSAGLELLGYEPPGRPAPASSPKDIVADWITIVSDGLDRARPMADPDGHRLMLIPSQQ